MTALTITAAIASGRVTALLTAAIVATAQVLPEWVLVLGMIVWARHGHSHGDDEVAFFSSAGAHLATGLPLRNALLLASERSRLPLAQFRRKLAAGVPLDRCGGALVAALPTQGAVLSHALAVSARSGGRLAPLTDRLAERAAAHLDLGHEARTASATARASVALLGGVPLVISVHRLTDDADGAEVLIAAGMALIAIGSAVGWLFIRRVRP